MINFTHQRYIYSLQSVRVISGLRVHDRPRELCLLKEGDGLWVLGSFPLLSLFHAQQMLEINNFKLYSVNLSFYSNPSKIASTYHFPRGVDLSSKYLTPSSANSDAVKYAASSTASAESVSSSLQNQNASFSLCCQKQYRLWSLNCFEHVKNIC